MQYGKIINNVRLQTTQNKKQSSDVLPADESALGLYHSFATRRWL